MNAKVEIPEELKQILNGFSEMGLDSKGDEEEKSTKYCKWVNENEENFDKVVKWLKELEADYAEAIADVLQLLYNTSKLACKYKV